MNALAQRTRVSVHGSRALGPDVYLLLVTPVIGNDSPAQALARINADRDVEIAEFDRPVHALAVPNDPLADAQWYLQANEPSAINAQAAWEITKGSNGVVIAVIDTGVRFEHPDLLRAHEGGRLLAGYDFVAPDNTGSLVPANDGDARDLDASDPGDWVLTNADIANTCMVTQPFDSSWHGTRVAGIIGAMTNNSMGVAGITWSGYIQPVRAFGKCHEWNANVYAGMFWAAGLGPPDAPANPHPAQILNLSLGAGLHQCGLAQSVIDQIVEATGVLVVAAAGNGGSFLEVPAACSGAMGVVGLSHTGAKVAASSLGAQAALGAPAGDCVNAPGAPCLFPLDTTSNSGTTSPVASTYTNQIDANVGTSYSAAVVSGIAGLMLAVNGNLKGPQLIQRMQAGAKPFPTPNGTLPVCHLPVSTTDVQDHECWCTTSTCGAGMANAEGAVKEALRPIAAISAPASVSPGQNVTLRAETSAAACNHTISSYAWAVSSGSATLTDADTSAATLQAPASGEAVIRLTVTDDAGRTDSADIKVTAATTSTNAPSNAGTTACLSAVSVSPLVTLTASDPNAAEAGPDTGTFTLARAGDTSTAITVSLEVGGSADAASDYTALPTSVTIPAGQTTATLTVTPINDTTVESAETVNVAIKAGSGYDVGTPSSAIVTIANNAVAPPPPESGGGGRSGGGGALDWATLLAALGLAGRTLRNRRAACTRTSPPSRR